MRSRLFGFMITVAAGGVLVGVASIPVAGQGRGAGPASGCPADSAKFHPCALEQAKTFNPPRTPDGKPDLQGIWGGGNFNIEANPGEGVPGTSGSQGSSPSRIVDPADGKIPYQPWALAQRDRNFESYIAPIVPCFLPGVPFQVLSSGGFRIVQTPGYVAFLTEFYGGAWRSIPMDGRPHVGSNIRLWMGDSRGRWEGNTLVVDVTNFNALNWVDRVGHFYSTGAHAVERWTLVDMNTLHYQATITDPKVFTRPWTTAFRLTRNREPGLELLEQACHEGDRDTPHLLEQGLKIYRGVVPPN